MRLTYLWTPEKDAFLRAKYDSRVRGRAAQIGQMWGWPAWQIKRRAQFLGLARPWPVDRRPWTTEEEAVIERYAGTRRAGWIAKRVHRSLTSVVIKMRRLRLSRCPDGLNQLAVAEAFGCSRDTVDKWLRHGWLHASHPPASHGERYGITEDDLLAFIRAYPTAFDLRTVDQTWFLDLVGGAPSPAPVVAAVVKVSSPVVLDAIVETVRRTGNATMAMAAVQISRSGLYHKLRTDPAFRHRYDEAKGQYRMAHAPLRAHAGQSA